MIKKIAIILINISVLVSQTWAITPFSTRELDELEKEFMQQINQSDSVIRNPLAKEYINHLGGLLAKHSHQMSPDFFIVKSKEINAFAGPGGHIGINTQLIIASDNESELAAVMAHEMAHVRLHHLYRRIEHQKQMRIPMLASILASAALGVLNPVLGSSAMMASMTGLAQDSINFTRANEKEADRIGINMLIKSGLNPNGMAAFFKKMQQNSRYYYMDNIPPILRSHPLDQDRIAEAENRSARLPKKRYTENPDYYFFKELIRNLSSENPKALMDYYQSRCKHHSNEIACAYGQSLAFLGLNQYTKAIQTLAPLAEKEPSQIYLQTALAQAEIGIGKPKKALSRLEEIYENEPEHYTVIMSYAQSLLDTGNTQKAASVLLKGFREYKKDLSLCMMLSLAQAKSKQKNYAYFTLAECELLQGRKRSAMQQLKTAQKLAKNDRYLKARISAKMEEIRESI